jgi:hypothetical protein
MGFYVRDEPRVVFHRLLLSLLFRTTWNHVRQIWSPITTYDGGSTH